MRKRLAIILAAWLGLASVCSAALVAQWKLQDNAASTTVVATVGSNGTLTNAGNTSASTTTGPGTLLTSALLFDGVNDHVSALTGNAAVLQNKAIFTMGCWFKCSTADTTGNHRLMFVSTGTANNTTRGSIQINTTGQILCYARAGDAEGLQSKTTTNSYDDNAWHHVAFVANIASDGITIYVDGTSVAQTGSPAFSATATENTASLGLTLANAFNVEPFKGSLADCRIYDSNESANLAAIMAEKDSATKISPAVLNSVIQ